MMQVLIFVTGLWMAFSLTRPNFRFLGKWYNTTPWAYVVGLMGQSAWLFESARCEQWGAFALSLWWTWCYVDGMWTYCRRQLCGR